MAKKKLFLTGPTREIPSGQNGPILAARVASKNAGFASSFPLADSAMHIVNDLFAIVMGVASPKTSDFYLLYKFDLLTIVLRRGVWGGERI